MRRFIPLMAVALAVGVAACEARPGESAGRTDTVSTPAEDADSVRVGPADPDAAPRADLRGYDTVFVYFDAPTPDGVAMGPLVPRPRAVPDTGALTFALAELLAGPTAADQADGPLYTWFSGETAGMLRRVELADGVVGVEFGDFRPIIPGASSSAGSASLLRQLEATVFQFPEVRRVEFRIDGSCEAFMAWLQIGCIPIPRGSFEPPDGYRMAVPSDPGAS